MSNDSYEQIKGTVKHITKKAVLFELDDGEEIWIPMSVIFEDDLAEIDVGVIGEISVAQWFYEREIQ